jgi:hypothetical protein
MLDLADDWDGEGTPGYEEATWRRAVGIVVNSATAFVEVHPDEIPPVPTFMPGEDGSVDILWDTENRRLMMIVPPSDEGPPALHGFDRSDARREIRAMINPDDRPMAVRSDPRW